jgi:hypothetical protein
MEKIKKYNQIILAIIGTIALLLLIIGGGMTLKVIYEELTWNNNYEEVSIISNEKVEELAGDSLRKQLITFKNIILIDTLNEKFLIPVQQSNLVNEEYIDDSNLFGMINSYSGGKGTYYYGGNYYNNLLVFDNKTNKIRELFENRISIDEFDKIEIENNVIVTIRVTTEDSNGDGFLNSKDLQQLFIYNVSEDKLVEIPAEGKDYIRLKILFPNEDFVVLYGIDKNKDGEFHSRQEPMFFYNLDINTGKTELLIKEEQLKSLQRKLDGRKENN